MVYIGIVAVKFHASNTIRHWRARGVSFGMSEVVIHDDENFERALKRFKKKCEKAGDPLRSSQTSPL